MGYIKDIQRYERFNDRSRSCMGKMAFSDKKMATNAATNTNNRFRRMRVRAYKCRHCPFWHIGKSAHMGKALQRQQEAMLDDLRRQTEAEAGLQVDETSDPSQSDQEQGHG